jgi:hypothetical protein
MKPPKFHVGQAVVCLYDSMQGIASDEGVIRKGQIYTVRLVEFIETGYYYGVDNAGNPDDSFPELYFAPAEYLPDEALAQLLEETLAEPVTH